jgi:hypothetical protein
MYFSAVHCFNRFVFPRASNTFPAGQWRFRESAGSLLMQEIVSFEFAVIF